MELTMLNEILANLYKIVHQSIFFQYTNVNELVWITLLILIAFLFRLMIRRHRLASSRARIPFVIGGWGTRGKSGTERKKAAMFHALGYNVLSKTTGCEAMVIHSKPGIDPIELPIYRPGDKSSIWEQEKVVGLASRLQSHILLWECMAVSSDYAGLMQNEWMHDDLSTLSNTFVDHENIQGPSGIDISRSMKPFIPVNSILFTAEETMLPILKLQAKRNNTEIIDLPWYKSDFFASDVLNLFPYKIHPRNLGIVLNMADYLKLDIDVILKEMSESIVPDLGAFNRFSAQYNDRILEFWNGMSANDRTSCLSNWTQAGFKERDLPERTWIVTLVNNRQDRIPRSFEFADILVNHTPAHRHFLVGTNLEGMQGYIKESIKRFAKQHAHFGEGMTSLSNEQMISKLTENFENTLLWLRIDGIHQEKIVKKCDVMLSGKMPQENIKAMIDHASELVISKDVSQASQFIATTIATFSYSKEISDQIIRDLCDYKSIHAFRNALSELNLSLEKEKRADHIRYLETEYSKLLQELLEAKLHVIWNPFVSGDYIVDYIANHAPPGYTIKIMGMQNIKGTGLDFAYRWVSLKTVQKSVEMLQSPDLEKRKAAIERLASHDDYGVLDVPVAIDGLSQAIQRSDNQIPEIQSVIEEAMSKLQGIQKDKLGKLQVTAKSRFSRFWIRFWEQLLDATDSKKRYRKSMQVMEDLFNERISHPTAAKILHELNKRQDGGWLFKK